MADRALVDRRVREILADIGRCHDDPAISARVRSLASQALEDPRSLQPVEARELAEIIAERSVTPPMYNKPARASQGPRALHVSSSKWRSASD